MRVELTGKRVLVTGATGFIGGRLVERLAGFEGVAIRVLVRKPSRLARLARFDVEIAPGDISDHDTVARAVEDCDVVVNCAYGSDGTARYQTRVNVDAVDHLVRRADTAGAERIVHVSTVSVYGLVADGRIHEGLPQAPLNDVYSRTKAEGEKAALALAAEGAPVVVLQPTVVYGPFGPAWTVNVLDQLSRYRVMLVDGGEGIANVVYIDDVVEALLLAIARDEALGEAFLVSGSEPVTWRRFYRRYEEMLGFESTIDVALDEIDGYRPRRRSVVRESLDLMRRDTDARQRILDAREPAALLRLARKVVPDSLEQAVAGAVWGAGSGDEDEAPEAEKPVLVLGRDARRLFAARSVASIDKAKRLLGYEPAVSFEEGMRRTEAWARWANLVPSD